MGIVYSDLLTVQDVAAQFKVNEHRVRNWINTGVLPAFRRGRDWLIEAHHADTFNATERDRQRKIM